MNIYDCSECGNCRLVPTCCAGSSSPEPCPCESCCKPVCPPAPCCPEPCCRPVTPPPCCLPGTGERSYAMYHITEGAVTSGTDLALVPILTGPNGTIVAASSASVYLAQRHIYEVSYQVTAAAQLAGSFTVDPILNNVPEANYSTTAAIAADGGAASVASTFLVSTVTAPVTLSLHYTGTTASTINGVLVIREIA